MKWEQRGNRISLALAVACALLAGCGGGGTTNVVSVSVFPARQTLIVNQQQQFNATVSGATDTTVTWSISSVPVPTSSTSTTPTPTPCDTNPTVCGTIDDKTKNLITYTAPAKVQNPAINVILTATSNADKKKTAQATILLDSGIRVSVTPAAATIGAGDPPFQFNATLTNDLTPNDVTWLVTQDSMITATSKSCSPACGSIDATGLYTAPTAVPTTPTLTVEAVSKLDTLQSGTATITLVTGGPSTFTGISPTTALQGALFQDIYLLATNLRSTTSVSFNGTPVGVSQLKVTTVTSTTTSGSTTTTTTSTSARLRLNAAQLSETCPATGCPIAVAGATGGPFNLQLVPVRPGLVASQPDSMTQTANAVASIALDGGFFGSPVQPGAPAVKVSFSGGGGGIRTFQFGGPQSPSNLRQLTVSLNPNDLGTPGLYSFSLQNLNGAQGTPASNFAVQPDPNTNGPTLAAPLSGPFTNPVAIALDSTIGTAIVANQGSANQGSVVRINMNGATPQVIDTVGLPITGTPAGVVVDEIRHIAAVVSSSVQTTTTSKIINPQVTLLDLQAGQQIAAIDLSTFYAGVTAPPPAGAPISVGLEPNSQLGIVAFSSSNVGAIFHYESPSPTPSTPACILNTQTSSPDCVVSVVTLSTGVSPQIAFHPALHWGFVTPGGTSAVMTIVDVTRPANSVPIATAQNTGLSRTSNVVTVKTTQAHNLNPATVIGVSAAGSVLVTGAADTSFNGAFAVSSVIDSQTFTYSQTGPNATSGGGQIFYSEPLATFNLGTPRGIAINPETQRAVLADPNANFSQISFLNLLDQTTSSLSLSNGTAPEIGATAVSYQPYSNIAVSVNPQLNQLSVLDPVRPQRLATISTGGTGSAAVVVDPATNLALVANTTSNNISVVSLGSIKGVHVSRWVPQPSVPASQILAAQTVFTSTASTGLPITIYGAGFSGTPNVRLDGVSIGSGTVVSGGRGINITVPASFLAAPRRYALDVGVSGVFSNVTDFAVVQSVNLSNTGCTAPQPQPFGAAIDDSRDLALVTDNACNSVYTIDLAPASSTFGQVTQTVAVGTAPTGVAVIPRLGLAVVANSNFDIANAKVLGLGSATVIDLTQNPPKAGQPISLGDNPTAVAMDQDTGRAYVVNTGSNTLTALDLNVSTPTASTTGVDQQPISIAIDPDRQVALVGAVQLSGSSAFGVLDIIDIATTSPSRTGTISTSASLPTGIVFDPAVNPAVFYAVSSLSNSFVVANPDNGGSGISVRVGLNPTSLAYNPQTGTLLTLNTISNTLSIVDAQTRTTRETLSLGTPPVSVGATNPQFAVAIHPRTNLAVIADELHGRVLLYPVPR